jgi:hypothetical protein
VLEELVLALLAAWLEHEQMSAVEVVMNPAFEVPSGDYDLSLAADREYIAGRMAGRRAIAGKRGLERWEAILEMCGLSGLPSAAQTDDVPADVRGPLDAMYAGGEAAPEPAARYVSLIGERARRA